MSRSTLVINGLDLSYLEFNKEAPRTIFFLHGNGQSARAWRYQYTAPLFSPFRLIVFDLPGHGASAFPGPEACSLPGLAAILQVAVGTLAGEKPYILAGVSLATNIIAEMLYRDSHPTGIVLAGPCLVGEGYPLEKLIKPGTHVQVVFTDEAAAGDVRSYAAETSSSLNPSDLEFFLEDYHTVRPPFRTLLGLSIAEGKYHDHISIVRQKNIPVLAVFGKDEQVVYPDYLDEAGLPYWRKQVYKLEGASHLVNIDRPGIFNGLLADFAKDVLPLK